MEQQATCTRQAIRIFTYVECWRRSSSVNVEPELRVGANALQTDTTFAWEQDHALIGNMRTAALISISGTVAQMCVPHFDSPRSVERVAATLPLDLVCHPSDPGIRD